MKNKFILATIIATSVVSTIGTVSFASSGSSKTIDGTVSKGIAFADKHSLFEGSLEEDDDEDSSSGFYYDRDLLDDDDDDEDIGSIGYKFGTKYVITNNGLFNLSKGELIDDTEEDVKYTAVKKLKNSLNKVSRFNVVNTADLSTPELQLTDRFGQLWYKTSIQQKKDDSQSDIIFFSDTGAYLDISYKTTIYYYDTENNKTVKINEFNDEQNGVTANLTDANIIAQDDKYLYIKANIQFTSENNVSNYTEIMKVSKSTKSDNDLKYPDSVSTYLVSDGTNNDSALLKATDLVDRAKDYTVVNDKLCVITDGDSGIEVTSLTLGKESIDFVTDGKSQNALIAKANKSDSIKSDLYCIDIDGKVWSVYKGKVKYFNGTEFKDYFSVDSSYDSVDAYDSSNILVWDSNSDAEDFVIRTGSSSYDDDDDDNDDEDDDEDEDGDTSDSDDSSDNLDSEVAVENTESGVTFQGYWDIKDPVNPSWINADGTASKDIWVYSNNAWYRVDENGKALKEWATIDDSWYYFDSSGKMLTGWHQISGYWYLFGTNGAMQTGWVKSGGDWYYLEKSSNGYKGTMQTGWIKDGDEDGQYWYYLVSNGVMKTGWSKINDTWYYFNYQGKMLQDIVVDGYYLSLDGSLQDISRRLNDSLREVKDKETSTNTTTETYENNDNYENSNNTVDSSNGMTFGATNQNGF